MSRMNSHKVGDVALAGFLLFLSSLALGLCLVSQECDRQVVSQLFVICVALFMSSAAWVVFLFRQRIFDWRFNVCLCGCVESGFFGSVCLLTPILVVG